MEKRITFVGQEHSPAMDKHINGQLEKIEHFLAKERSPVFIEVVAEFHPKHQHHKVTARVKTPHYDCYAEHEGPDVYFEINEAIDRLYKQLRTEKQKFQDHQKHGCDKECRAAFFHDELDQFDSEDNE